MRVTATYIGGPTALIEFSGVRFLTDPTFDPAGSSYETPVYTLCKTIGPALVAEALEPTGFLITQRGQNPQGAAVYVSGDTVWYEGIEEVAHRADVRVAFAFMGAARVREVGPAHLTLTAAEGVLLARAMPRALIVPLHYEGWAHFSEGRTEIEHAFSDAGLAERVRWLTPGEPTLLLAS